MLWITETKKHLTKVGLEDVYHLSKLHTQGQTFTNNAIGFLYKTTTHEKTLLWRSEAIKGIRWPYGIHHGISHHGKREGNDDESDVHCGVWTSEIRQLQRIITSATAPTKKDNDFDFYGLSNTKSVLTKIINWWFLVLIADGRRWRKMEEDEGIEPRKYSNPITLQVRTSHQRYQTIYCAVCQI